MQTHGVLLQYLELLTTPLVVPSQDYAQKVLPSLAELGEKFGICAPICMQIIRPMLNGLLLVSAEFGMVLLRNYADVIVIVQKAALAMQEKERVANEEAEKRLKAALTAKREPSSTTSRVSSPSVGTTHVSKDISGDQKPVAIEPTSTEDGTMDTDPASVRLSQSIHYCDVH